MCDLSEHLLVLIGYFFIFGAVDETIMASIEFLFENKGASGFVILVHLTRVTFHLIKLN